MDRNEKRAVIKYLTLKGLSAVEISTELNSVLRDNTPSDATIYRWIAEFQRGRKSTEDEQRSGRPVDMSCARMKMFNVSTIWLQLIGDWLSAM